MPKTSNRRRGRTWSYAHDVTHLRDESQVETLAQLADDNGLIRLAVMEAHIDRALCELEHVLSRTEPYADEKRHDDATYPTRELEHADSLLLLMYDRLNKAARDSRIFRNELHEALHTTPEQEAQAYTNGR